MFTDVSLQNPAFQFLREEGGVGVEIVATAKDALSTALLDGAAKSTTSRFTSKKI